MTHDRLINISTARSRRETYWTQQQLTLAEFYARLSAVTRSSETYAAYTALPKSKQDELKDVGGFVGGSLLNGRRKAGCVLGRDVITLDIDALPPGGTQDVIGRLLGLGCGYAVYSTRKHAPQSPRLRVILPVNRTLLPDEYEPAARKAAELIYPGMEPFDASTFEPSRLMYWASCCADAEFIWHYSDMAMLDAGGLLGLYQDWRDATQWPQVPGTAAAHQRTVDKQADPTTKDGIVGAFCRAYDVPAAMDTFLPGVYVPAGPGRYTFAEGSTVGGAVLYDNGKFLFSHHGTDPASGALCNAFDLVRIHKFSEQDDEAKPGTPPNRMPSYTAMARLAAADVVVSAQLNADKQAQLQADFGGIMPAPGTQPQNAVLPAQGFSQGGAPTREFKVRRDKSGGYEKDINNLYAILETDPVLMGKWVYNEFAERAEILGPLPWYPMHDKTRSWTDADNAGLRGHFQQYYGVNNRGDVKDAKQLYIQWHRYNPVTDYLNACRWDGSQRLDTLLVDYLGAEDTPYVRAVTRKGFVACVARALNPGVKFDCMPAIISPRQGIGKSSLLRILAGSEWFTDSIYTFEGKDAMEQIQGKWIIEIAEMHAMRKVDDTRIRQILSSNQDRFRGAYKEEVAEFPRRCVFFGTGNNRQFLRDLTGNRRVWPIDVDKQPATKNVFRDLEQERDQIWAEAVLRYRMGERIFFDHTDEGLLDEVLAQQEAHMEEDPQEGRIREFLEKPVPTDWMKRSWMERRNYWYAENPGEDGVKLRDRICALEIWVELFRKQPEDLTNRDTAAINARIIHMGGWEQTKSASKFGGGYGLQRGFKRM